MRMEKVRETGSLPCSKQSQQWRREGEEACRLKMKAYEAPLPLPLPSVLFPETSRRIRKIKFQFFWFCRLSWVGG